jgi:DNA-binding transcriptional regulator YhcF (GntR family)
MTKEIEMTAAVKQADQNSIDKSVAAKWGATLAKAGWTSFPNIIFERQNALGLTALDINILLHLAGYWWRPNQNAHPSKKTIALAIGVTPRTVQKRIADMEKAGFLKRHYRKTGLGDNDTNEYDLSGLIALAKPFAEEKIADRQQRQKEQAERLTRKKPLKIVKGSK